jgi:hypothetical protein
VCWLRKYECFCEVLSSRKSHYESTDAIKNVKVCNTAPCNGMGII